MGTRHLQYIGFSLALHLQCGVFHHPTTRNLGSALRYPGLFCIWAVRILNCNLLIIQSCQMLSVTLSVNCWPSVNYWLSLYQLFSVTLPRVLSLSQLPSLLIVVCPSATCFLSLSYVCPSLSIVTCPSINCCLSLSLNCPSLSFTLS